MTESQEELQATDNKYEMAEIEYIQQEIQSVTKKIEHEKISLRILKERNEKKKSEYAQLEGRPGEKSKEEKEKLRKDRLEQLKKHKYYESISPRQSKQVNASEEHMKISKSTNKAEIEFENLTKEINHLLLDNKNLTKEVDDLRKERCRINNQLNNLNTTNKKIEENINQLMDKNKQSVAKIKFNELVKTQNEGSSLQKNFEADRDTLEGKYHEIVESNIRRERENKKELSKKRLMLGAIAENVKPKNGKNNPIIDQMKMMENDEINDRTPILDKCIEKWKYITKYKKNMIEKYIKNSHAIKEAFDKMTLFLGVDSFKDLPGIYSKTQEQMISIETYNSNMENELGRLKEKCNLLEKQIEKLKKDKNFAIIEKQNRSGDIQGNIIQLKKNNQKLEENIEKKRQFFLKIQPKTIDFLNKLQNTYLADFVPEKITINEGMKINESNIIEFLSCVENFCLLIKEFDKSTQEKTVSPRDSMDISNRDLDRLKKEIEGKLDKFKSDNYVTNNLYSSLKNDIKVSNNFDETIKRMAGLIADSVNSPDDIFFKKKRRQSQSSQPEKA